MIETGIHVSPSTPLLLVLWPEASTMIVFRFRSNQMRQKASGLADNSTRNGCQQNLFEAFDSFHFLSILIYLISDRDKATSPSDHETILRAMDDLLSGSGTSEMDPFQLDVPINPGQCARI